MFAFFSDTPDSSQNILQQLQKEKIPFQPPNGATSELLSYWLGSQCWHCRSPGIYCTGGISHLFHCHIIITSGIEWNRHDGTFYTLEIEKISHSVPYGIVRSGSDPQRSLGAYRPLKAVEKGTWLFFFSFSHNHYFFPSQIIVSNPNSSTDKQNSFKPNCLTLHIQCCKVLNKF